MKIYTKTGDTGETSLLGGVRVKKSDDQVEAYGTIDELNGNIALVSDVIDDNNIKQFLIFIQNKLFNLGSIFAAADLTIIDKLDGISDNDIKAIELEIDKINETLPELKSFILPGGCYKSSVCYIAKAVCRRAERRVVKIINNESEKQVNGLMFLNRLSDYLFTLSRKLSIDNNIKDRIWVK